MPLLRDERLRQWQSYEATLAALQADPEAWSEYQMARTAWDSALRSGGGRVDASNGVDEAPLSARRCGPDR